MNDPMNTPDPHMDRIDYAGRVEKALNGARRVQQPLFTSNYDLFQIANGLALLEQVAIRGLNGQSPMTAALELQTLQRRCRVALSPLLQEALDNNRRAAGLAPLPEGN